MSSKKILNDKYYTPRSLAAYVVAKTNEIIGRSNITEYLEPSGGAGVFLDFLPEGTYSCDIEPEDDRVVQGNFLDLDSPYKQGRCVIGNPPYGTKGNLFTQFYNDVEIVELLINKNGRGKAYDGFKYDIGICAWGASVGEQVEYENQYAKEFYFIIHNDYLKDGIIQAIKDADWCKEYPMTATPNLLHWQVGKYLRKVVKGIK